MTSLTLQPVRRVDGVVHLPGSKSVSNRALLLAALAEGTTTLSNVLDSDDTRHMRTALSELGVQVDWQASQRSATIHGHGGPLTVSNERRALFLGNAGTAMRPLTAALCLGRGQWRLDGEPRMRERPIGDLVDALRQLGARIDYLGEAGFPPLAIDARGLRGGHTVISGHVSSQFLTALLIAAPLADEPVTIEVADELVSKPYIDITLALMSRFGVEVEREGYKRFRVPRAPYRSPGQILVEGDASSASYFLAAAAVRGGRVRVYGIGRHSVQGDVAFLDVLEAMGAHVQRGDDFVEVARGQLNAVDVDLNHIPDAAMTAAVIGLFARGRTTIRNIANWRVKETDRLAAMATELAKLGAEVEEGPDYLSLAAPGRLVPAAIDTYDDHRMAMCFSLAALGDVAITINDPECVAKTFPDYFEVLASLGE